MAMTGRPEASKEAQCNDITLLSLTGQTCLKKLRFLTIFDVFSVNECREKESVCLATLAQYNSTIESEMSSEALCGAGFSNVHCL